jgi:hypothetical protein
MHSFNAWGDRRPISPRSLVCAAGACVGGLDQTFLRERRSARGRPIRRGCHPRSVPLDDVGATLDGPREEILVSKAHGDAPEHEHVMVAIKDAFAAAQRQIKKALSHWLRNNQ